MPNTLFDPKKKKVVRKKITADQKASAYLRKRKNDRMKAAEKRAYKRKQVKRNR